MDPFRVPPIITLTTDFGLVDHYVATMKGVLLSRCPDARLVDISHEIRQFSIVSAAYAIDQAAPYFPAATVHLVVVDPGVGTSRRTLLVEALGQYFVAPDNGVLSLVLARADSPKLRELTNRKLWAESTSSTFHGRDIFAPVAAAIAGRKAQPEDVGPLLSRVELLPDVEPERLQLGTFRGKVLSVDHFGNVITNFKVADFTMLSTRSFSIQTGSHEIKEYRPTFGTAPRGLCFAYFGSSGYIELGMNQENAAAILALSLGDSVTLLFSA